MKLSDLIPDDMKWKDPKTPKAERKAAKWQGRANDLATEALVDGLLDVGPDGGAPVVRETASADELRAANRQRKAEEEAREAYEESRRKEQKLAKQIAKARVTTKGRTT
jgi:F0F1-type ATP synthase epsilon subunit